MFNLLRRARTARDMAASLTASPGEGRRVYAIGDVHGCLDLLAALVERIVADNAARGPLDEVRLVLLGDLIDRGPDSAKVLDYVIGLTERWPDLECLMGNHEEIFLAALRGESRALGVFRNMGDATLLSYGLSADLIENGEEAELLSAMLSHVPERHRDFLADRPDSLILGDYCFVHAGIRPGVPLELQEGRDMRWIRNTFLKSRTAHSHVIIHGHSISDDVDVHPFRIGIDTGAYLSTRLTAIGLEGTERWFLTT